MVSAKNPIHDFSQRKLNNKQTNYLKQFYVEVTSSKKLETYSSIPHKT